MQIIYFYRPLRILLRDFDASAQQYTDGVLADGVKTSLQLNLVPTLALTPDELSVTPSPTAAEYSLLTLKTAKLFVANQPDRGGFRTRAYSESWGSFARFLQELDARIQEQENGDGFSSYQNYYSWLHGHAGLPLGEVLAQFDVQAPLWRATFTRDGMRVA